jgi:hypothetical protein
VVISPTEPENFDVLWADTSEEGDAVLPVGGTTGQALVKASDGVYDAEWVTLDTDGVVEAGNLYFTADRARAAVLDPFFLMGA